MHGMSGRKNIAKGEKMKFWVKARAVNQDIRSEFVVSVCDKEILGKTIDGKKITENFYKGELMEESEMLTQLKKATVGNIFGNNSVEAALNAELVSKDGIKEFDGVKHAQIFTV